MINQSSLEVFELIKPELSKRQALVLYAIHHLNINNIPCSDKQISNFLKLPINQIVPRRAELEKFNRIYSIGRFYDGISQVKCNLWHIRGGL